MDMSCNGASAPRAPAPTDPGVHPNPSSTSRAASPLLLLLPSLPLPLPLPAAGTGSPAALAAARLYASCRSSTCTQPYQSAPAYGCRRHQQQQQVQRRRRHARSRRRRHRRRCQRLKLRQRSGIQCSVLRQEQVRHTVGRRQCRYGGGRRTRVCARGGWCQRGKRRRARVREDGGAEGGVERDEGSGGVARHPGGAGCVVRMVARWPNRKASVEVEVARNRKGPRDAARRAATAPYAATSAASTPASSVSGMACATRASRARARRPSASSAPRPVTVCRASQWRFNITHHLATSAHARSKQTQVTQLSWIRHPHWILHLASAARFGVAQPRGGHCRGPPARGPPRARSQ